MYCGIRYKSCRIYTGACLGMLFKLSWLRLDDKRNRAFRSHRFKLTSSFNFENLSIFSFLTFLLCIFLLILYSRLLLTRFNIMRYVIIAIEPRKIVTKRWGLLLNWNFTGRTSFSSLSNWIWIRGDNASKIEQSSKKDEIKNISYFAEITGSELILKEILVSIGG